MYRKPDNEFEVSLGKVKVSVTKTEDELIIVRYGKVECTLEEFKDYVINHIVDLDLKRMHFALFDTIKTKLRMIESTSKKNNH